MRLKNKKALLSFLILHSWCYGIDTQEIESLVAYIKNNYDMTNQVQETKARAYIKDQYPNMPGSEILKILRKAAPKAAQSEQQSSDKSAAKSDELNRSVREWLYTYGQRFIAELKKQNVTKISDLSKDKLFNVCKNIFGTNTTFQAPLWTSNNFSTEQEDQLKTHMLRALENPVGKVATIVIVKNNVDKFISILQHMLDGKSLADLGVEEPKAAPKQAPAPMPGMAAPVATQQQIMTWVNKHSTNIIAQLKVEGIAHSSQINFETIITAATKVGGIPLPKLKSSQQSMLLGRLGFPPPPPPPAKLPPPPPLPKAAKKTAEQLAQEEADRQIFGNQNPGAKLPPPPPPMPGKGPLPTPLSNDLLLNETGKEILVDAIRLKFDEAQEQSQERTPSNDDEKKSSHEQVNHQKPLSKQDQKALLVKALELGLSIKTKN